MKRVTRSYLTALLVGTFVLAIPFFAAWRGGLFSKRPSDDWPDAWRNSSPLPEVYLATRAYIDDHGFPPKSLDDLKDIVVPSTGTSGSGRPIVARTVTRQMGRDMKYYPEHLNLENVVDNDELLIATQQVPNTERLQAIFWSGRVSEMSSDAIESQIQGLRDSLNHVQD